MLLLWNGLCGCCDTGPFQQDPAPFLRPTDIQLYPQRAATLGSHTLPSTSGTKASVRDILNVWQILIRCRPDGKLDPSTAEIENPSSLTIFCLQVLHFFGLAKVQFSPDKRRATTTNLTLLNFILLKTGPVKEPTLTNYVTMVQIFCSIVAFAVRYGLAGLLYDGDRR